MVLIQSYCEANASISRTWLDRGISPCFYFTLVPTILLTVAVFLGTLHCVFYQKYGTVMEPKFIPRSLLFRLQQALTVLLLVQFAVGAVWRAAASGAGGEELPGYALLYAGFSALAWAWAMALLRTERRRALLMDRTRGHSAALLLFWALAFAAENLAFISWYSPHWWWGLEDSGEQVSGGGGHTCGIQGNIRSIEMMKCKDPVGPAGVCVQVCFRCCKFCLCS